MSKTKAVVSIPVWGDEYIYTFLNYLAPCMLAPGNMGHLSKKTETEIYILTDLVGAHAIRRHPIFKQLQEKGGANKVTIEIYPTEKCNMNPAQHLAIKNTKCSHIFFLVADIILPRDSFKILWQQVEAGYDALLCAAFRTWQESLYPELAPFFDHKGILDIPSKDLTSASFKAMQLSAECHKWESQFATDWPSYSMYPVAEKQYLYRAFHMNPMVMNVENYTDEIMRKEVPTYDAALRDALGIDPKKTLTINHSNDLFVTATVPGIYRALSDINPVYGCERITDDDHHRRIARLANMGATWMKPSEWDVFMNQPVLVGAGKLDYAAALEIEKATEIAPMILAASEKLVASKNMTDVGNNFNQLVQKLSEVKGKVIYFGDSHQLREFSDFINKKHPDLAAKIKYYLGKSFIHFEGGDFLTLTNYPVKGEKILVSGINLYANVLQLINHGVRAENIHLIGDVASLKKLIAGKKKENILGVLVRIWLSRLHPQRFSFYVKLKRMIRHG